MDYDVAREKLRQLLQEDDMCKGTVHNYLGLLKKICEFTNKFEDVSLLVSKDIDDFLESKQKDQGTMPSTLYNYKAGFEYLFKHILSKSLELEISIKRKRNRSAVSVNKITDPVLPVEVQKPYQPHEITEPITIQKPYTPKISYVQKIFVPFEGAIELDSALTRLVQELELKGISQTTQGIYFKSIKKFVNAMCKQDDLRMLTIYDVKNFIHTQRFINNIAFTTCNSYICAIKYLFVLVLQKDWQDACIPYFKLPERLPTILPKETVKQLINSIDNKMHRMIAIIMYSSGLRVSEAIALRLTDIKRVTKQIFVHQGKGSKERYAILSTNCLIELENYWREFRPSNYLFPSIKFENNYVSKRTIQTTIEFSAQKLGLKGVTSHTLRHCFATHLIEANTDVFHTMEAMGHKCLKTTHKYVHLASMSGLNVKSPYDLW